jgi:hypothetical protein
MKTCPDCYGDGVCRNDFHPEDTVEGLVDLAVDFASLVVGGRTCPACGEYSNTPGKCSSCGGTGEVEDDEESQ